VASPCSTEAIVSGAFRLDIPDIMPEAFKIRGFRPPRPVLVIFPKTC
jgi:hypothetical protein